MKKHFCLKIGRAFGLVSVLLFSSCQTEEISETFVLEEEPEITAYAEETDPTLRVNNQVLFPVTAKVLGKSNDDWAIVLGKIMYGLDCENINQAQLLNLSDKVVSPFGSLENSTLEYTITKDQFVFLPSTFFFNNHPCPPEYEWEPAEGQSMEDFLKETAKEILNAVETLEVFFDGQEIEEVNKYRLSTDLFLFTGNPELTGCFDLCITGDPQPGLIDGYFMMFKKMKIGKHTIVIKGEIPSFEINFEITILLNVIK